MKYQRTIGVSAKSQIANLNQDPNANHSHINPLILGKSDEF
jgi:hypothetical protein